MAEEREMDNKPRDDERENTGSERRDSWEFFWGRRPGSRGEEVEEE